MQDLKVSLVQSDLAWESPEQNLKNFEKKLQQIVDPTDLIVLPEMFPTGFTMNVEKCSEDTDGISVAWLRKMANLKKSVITGSILIKEGGNYYNRMFWMRSNGTFEKYDKRHLFSMSNEHLQMTSGKKQTIVELNGWKINLQICYDLRFPVWSKNKYDNGAPAYDVLIYVANWPEVRSHAYKSLLLARAIENQAYVMWVNRVGEDGNKIKHSGDTMVVDAYGKIIQQAQPFQEESLFATLSYSKLTDFRSKFKVGLDWDKFSIDL